MQPISRHAFKQLKAMFHEASGITLSDEKRSLMEARLRKRLEALALTDFDAYCQYLKRPDAAEERQLAVDLLTTNETYFFREPEQFQLLSQLLDTRFAGKPLRVWSAASSTGEEPYSLAMLLLDKRPHGGWELRASDLAQTVLTRARRGVYPLKRLEHMPQGYLERFCLRGKGDYAGSMRVNAEVRRSVHFFQHNLMRDAPSLGSYEVIFLRNVLIYFDADRKQRILSMLVGRLRPDGVLFVGHAESLQGHVLPVKRIGRSVYEKTR
jgi:chemotaxis protein methyltransferase CheR